MLLCEFNFQSTSYSMPSSMSSPAGGHIDGPRSLSSIVNYLSKKRKKKKKRRTADVFDLHHYPNRRETNISYDSNKRQKGNIEWRRRYEKYGLSRKSSDNRDRSDLDQYIGHYTINR